ncbi:phosphoribosylformylglycinamidine cyclo-ligase, partial [Candidatus Peregrinibacteria bacterium CG11_big_fil_rev_8_21_14_0_20_41_10]
MTTYSEAGVDISTGDKASKIAYTAAKSTFSGREGRMGAPAILEGGFAGMLDFGDFYLVQNDDGVGTKMM